MAVISIPSSIGGVAIPGSIINGPLGALFGNKYGRSDYQYPRDLGSSTKGHMVIFDIIQLGPTGYDANKTYTATDLVNGVTDNITKTTNTAVEAFQSGGLSSALSSVSESLSLTPPTRSSVGSISLYMPDTMQFTYDSNYNEVNMTDVIKDTIGAIPVVGKSISGAVDSDITKLILKSQGLAINPKQQLLFDGINLRTYQMVFTFTPYSQQEAQTVKNIINTIKKWARPQTVKGAGGMLFIPPAMFQPTFMFNGAENTNINKVAMSVVESIDVNYAPNGWATHKDGAPVQTILSMQFKETELIDRDKVVSGGY